MATLALFTTLKKEPKTITNGPTTSRTSLSILKKPETLALAKYTKSDQASLATALAKPDAIAVSTKCDICRTIGFEANATFACIQCQKQLCNGCTAKHSGDRLLAHHQVIRILISEGLHVQCPQHPEERLQQFCVTCQRSICIVCVLALHDNHEKQQLKVYVDRQRRHIEELTTEADLKHLFGADAIQQLETLASQLDEQAAKARDQLQLHYQLLLDALTRKRDQLERSIEKHVKDSHESLARCRDELEQRLYRLQDYSQMARKLVANDARLMRLSQRFFTNFSTALDIEPDSLEEVDKHAVLSFIPSYDINIGALRGGERSAHFSALARCGDMLTVCTTSPRGVGGGVDSVYKDEEEEELDTTTASLWSTTESSSLGFHDDHWTTSLGTDLDPPLSSSSVGQWSSNPASPPARRESTGAHNNSSGVGQWDDPASPIIRGSSGVGIGAGMAINGKLGQTMNNLHVVTAPTTQQENALRKRFGQISPVREIKPLSMYVQEPRLLFKIAYKGVTSTDPVTIETFATVPIDVEFKNEHKLFVTQWGVHPKQSKNCDSIEYRQAKTGMVLYSLCCDAPTIVTSFDDCSPWSVASSKGRFLVSDLRNDSRTLRKYLADGSFNEGWVEYIFNTPRGMAAYQDKIIISDTHHRRVYVTKEDESGYAEVVTCIGEVGKLRRFKSESNLNATAVSYSDTQFINPLFVTTTSTGLILVSDAGDNCIKVYTQRGVCLKRISETRPGVPLDTPMGICTDTIDNIYVADYGNHRVCKFNKHGQYLGDVVSASTGGVYSPRGIDLYHGYLAVSCHNEQNDPEVRVFEIAQQLARQTEPQCECQWLRLCAEQQ